MPRREQRQHRLGVVVAHVDGARRLGRIGMRQVAAETEVVAGAAQHDDAGIARRVDHHRQCRRHVVGDAIADLRPVQRDRGHAVLGLARDGRRHECSLFRSFPCKRESRGNIFGFDL
jgi:hypothetical protein